MNRSTKFYAILVSITLIFSACDLVKENTSTLPTTASTNLVDSTKGFKILYSYIDTQFPLGSNIVPVDMTTEGSNKLNLAFLVYATGKDRILNRITVDYSNKSLLNARTEKTIAYPFSSNREIFSFAPFTNKLVYGYTQGSYWTVTGDIIENSGVQSSIGLAGRIAKNQHLVVNPFYLSDGIDKGDIYGTMINGQYQVYWDYAGYTGSSPFNEGIFEPFTGTNEGVLIAFHKDSVVAFTRDLTNTNKYKAVRNSGVVLNKNNAMALITTTGKNTIIKNNESNHDFSFAIYGNDSMDREFLFSTFKYNYATKSISTVIELGSFWKNEVLAYDIDPEGNFYCIKTDKTLYKTVLGGTTSKIAENFIVNGTPKLLKVYNGKIFIAVTNLSNNKQIELVVKN